MQLSKKVLLGTLLIIGAGLFLSAEASICPNLTSPFPTQAACEAAACVIAGGRCDSSELYCVYQASSTGQMTITTKCFDTFTLCNANVQQGKNEFCAMPYCAICSGPAKNIVCGYQEKKG